MSVEMSIEMSVEMSVDTQTDVKRFICKICNVGYKTSQSLWNHKNKYHTNNNSEKKIKKINEDKNTLKCQNCNKTFATINILDKHTKTECKPDIKHNNVFTFKVDTFGKNKYPDNNGGDIYIIQTDFSVTGYYKIGVTTNIYKRMQQYRCGAVLEPRVHCYFPIKNIKEADKLLKTKLTKYNVKREIYTTDDLEQIKTIIKDLQKEMKSESLEVLPEIKQCDMIKCKDCDIVFTNKYEYSIHRFQEHDNQYVKYSCQKCNKSLSRLDNLKRHEKKCIKENNDVKIIFIKKLVDEMKAMKEEIAELKKIVSSYQLKETNPKHIEL